MIGSSVADRVPTARKRGSIVGFLVDPFRRRKVWYESRLEMILLQCLIASADVIDVREQQTATYRQGDETRRHIFDVVIVWASGARQASPIKYEADVDDELLAAVGAVCDQQGDSFADDYVLLTELDTHPTTTANASWIISCGLDFDFEAQAAIRDFLRYQGPEVSLRQCDDHVGDGHRGSRAAIALVQAGLLAVPDGVLLGRHAVLRNCFTN